MPDTIRLDNVPGQNIIFRNFRGRSTPFTREGDRSFCLVVFSSLIRDQLAARGCNIKKFTNGTEFVNVAVRIEPGPEENADRIWTLLDMEHIDKVDLEFMFYEYNINGKKGTKIYLKNADVHIKAFNDECYTIGIRYPGYVTCTIDNKNNTEETKMENIMSVEEIITQFALMEYTYKNANSTDKKNLEDIMKAIRSAKHYLIQNEVTEDKPAVTGYELEKAGDFAAIKQVMFNDNATIVVWFDDVKTVVKCQKGDTFDKEKGLAMAICKRLYGNESNFNNIIKKYVNDDKNVQTKKKAKSGTFEERKAARMAQAEANKTANGRSKNFRGKDIVPRKRRRAPAIVNTNKMVVLTDAYADCVRRKMAKMGFSYGDTAKATGLSKSTINRYFSPNVVCQKPKRITMANFKKINKTLGIRWRIEG